MVYSFYYLKYIFYKFVEKILRIKFFCPICKAKVVFGSYGINPRPFAQCTRCKSLERHRFIYLFLRRKKLLNKTNIKLLHVSPEQCFINRFETLFKKNYITGDLLSNSFKVILDITKIQYVNNYFDFIICNHVLEHVSNDKTAFKEFYRVLKKNGYLLITVPIEGDYTYEDSTIVTSKERLRAFHQNDHVRIYGLDIVERITKAGFKVDIIKPTEILSKKQIHDYSIDNSMAGIILLCSK